MVSYRFSIRYDILFGDKLSLILLIFTTRGVCFITVANVHSLLHISAIIMRSKVSETSSFSHHKCQYISLIASLVDICILFLIIRSFIVSSETISCITVSSLSTISLGSPTFKNKESSPMNLPESENLQLHTSTLMVLSRYKNLFSSVSFCDFAIL